MSDIEYFETIVPVATLVVGDRVSVSGRDGPAVSGVVEAVSSYPTDGYYRVTLTTDDGDEVRRSVYRSTPVSRFVAA